MSLLTKTATAFGLLQTPKEAAKLLKVSTSWLAKARMRVIEGTCDGFAIAEEDMKFRGPGDFYGSRQSGLPDLRVADLDTGGVPGYMQSTLRWLVLHVAFWADWSVYMNRTHRGPHDRAAGTVVVYSS